MEFITGEGWAPNLWAAGGNVLPKKTSPVAGQVDQCPKQRSKAGAASPVRRPAARESAFSSRAPFFCYKLRQTVGIHIQHREWRLR
jgi:hypothetical protein